MGPRCLRISIIKNKPKWLHCSTLSLMARAIILQVRITLPEKAAFTKASQATGVTLASWVRESLRTAAVKELGFSEYCKLFMETPE